MRRKAFLFWDIGVPIVASEEATDGTPFLFLDRPPPKKEGKNHATIIAASDTRCFIR